MNSPGDLIACTIASKSSLSLARTLADSYRRHHPNAPFVVLLLDRIDGCFDPAREAFEIVEVETLGIPDFRRLSFQCDVAELTTAVKPYFLARLLARGYRKVLCFDVDVLVLSGLGRLAELLDRHAIVVTPRLMAPYEDTLSPTEIDVLRAGVLDPGFIGLVATGTTDRFLRWWSERFSAVWRTAPETGPVLEQRWLDLVPALYDDVYILRDPSFNVGYWNLHERRVEADGDQITVAGRPCRFFHFSGFDPLDLSRASSNQTRFSMEGIGGAAALFRRYRDLLLAHGHDETRAWQYAFGTFANGVRIPDIARRMYCALGDEARRFGDPFDTRRRPSFFHWLRRGVDGPSLVGAVPRLWYEIYHQQPTLQLLYPDVLGRDRDAFRRWIVERGASEHHVDPALVPSDVVGRPVSGGPLRRGARGVLNAVLRLEAMTKQSAKEALRAHPVAFTTVKRFRDRVQPRPVTGRVSSEPGAAVQVWPGEGLGVNVAGYFNSEKGVGEAARSTVSALRAAGVPVTLNNVLDYGSANRESTGWAFSERNPHPINLVHVNVDRVAAFVAERGEAYFRRRVNVGFWFWELSTFPDDWRPRFHRLDEIWVATAFTQEAVARVSPVPVVRIPVAIEPKPEHVARRDRARFSLPEDAFVFLFVFDFHSQLERKNPLALVEAFRLAFGDRDDVVLVLKSTHATDVRTGEQIQQVHEAATRAKNIVVMDTVLAREELDALLDAADCYASLHRSEGFGLPIAECMSRGTPVIVTAYSGNMDFTTTANSFLVKYRLVEVERDHGPYRKGSLWADPDCEHAAELMRYVVDHPNVARDTGRRGREDIERFHHPHRVGDLMKDRLGRLLVDKRLR